LACSFWLADCLHMIGRTEDASALFHRLLDLRNDLGLLSEEYDAVHSRQVGNFPQAFSHVSLVNTACRLSGRELISASTNDGDQFRGRLMGAISGPSSDRSLVTGTFGPLQQFLHKRPGAHRWKREMAMPCADTDSAPEEVGSAGSAPPAAPPSSGAPNPKPEQGSERATRAARTRASHDGKATT